MKQSKHTPGQMHKFGDYLISSLGNVYSNTGWRSHSARPMSQLTDKYGYKYVRLTVNSKREKFMVHRLVCILFNGARPETTFEVCHIDGDKNNNAATNLRWGTRKDNANDRERHGRTSRGLKHSIAIKKGIYHEKSK